MKRSMIVFVMLGVSLVVMTHASLAFDAGVNVRLAAPEEVGISSERLENIDDLVEWIVDSQRAKGAIALVARKGKIVYLNSYGERDEGLPMLPDTLWRACSMTKFITAIAAMMLYEEGALTLHDPVSKYIPEFENLQVRVEDKANAEGYTLVPANRSITIRHLLGHTSGITYAFWGRPFISECYLNEGVEDGLSVANGTMLENVKKLTKCPLMFHPGEGYEYGLNMDVLGAIVEIVSGMTLEKFFEERIFKPLGMVDTHFYLPEEKVSRLAAIYEKDEQGNLRKITGQDIAAPGVLNPDVETNIYDAMYPYTGDKKFFSGGAGLTTTVMDYVRVCQMFLNGGELDGVRLLSPLTVELMKIDFSNGQPAWITPEGWYQAAGGVVLEDRVPTATIVGDRTFFWDGYYVTRFEIDAENELIYMLITQRPVYLFSDFNEEWAKFRILSHTAITTKN